MKWAVVATKERRRAVGGLRGVEVGVVAQVENACCFLDVYARCLCSMMFKCITKENVYILIVQHYVACFSCRLKSFGIFYLILSYSMPQVGEITKLP